MSRSRLAPSDVVYGLAAFALTALVVLPWLSTELLPLMDYPMFLSFARAWLDMNDPASPFHGTYTLGWPLSPLVAPLAITAGIGSLTSLETGGRALWILYAVGLLAAGAWALRALGQDRWKLVLFAPLVFGKWTASGFVGFVTGAPLVLLAGALGVLWLDHPTRRRGVALAAVSTLLALWHALLIPEALLALGVLWLCRQGMSWRARIRSLVPLLPAAALLAAWASQALGRPQAGARPIPTVWAPATEFLSLDLFFDKIFMVWPGSSAWAKALALVLVLGALLPRDAGEEDLDERRWRLGNPFIAVALVTVACWFALPANAFGVEIVQARFAWLTALWVPFAWRLPSRPVARAAVVAAAFGVSVGYLTEVGQRFRAFHAETIGASRLVDSLPQGATLLAPLGHVQTRALANNPIREIQQLATIRKGGLPTTSFASYGVNVVRFVNGNPKPSIFAHDWQRHPRLGEFEHVLLRAPKLGDGHPALRELRRDGDWVLYRVCARPADPGCGP
ncbi:MAG: hypothetical protein IT376_19030 [Polyangiaceae bacterium]|nr:hypothetical protein [Polyangiaceae bacterium]